MQLMCTKGSKFILLTTEHHTGELRFSLFIWRWSKLSSYQGYVPTFVGDLNDYNATFGYKSVKNDWNTDVSITTGGNKQTYTVSNSLIKR
jgi:hypothetical protein